MCREKENCAMPVRLKKLIGTFLLVSLVIIYAVFATIIAVAHLAESSAWVHLLYFFVTGILWVLPAMCIIWWMAQPPRKKQH
jgi:hypothetical protein